MKRRNKNKGARKQSHIREAMKTLFLSPSPETGTDNEPQIVLRSCNVRETEENFLIKVEVQGLGKRKGLLDKNLASPDFQRRISNIGEVESSAVSATLRNSVLRLTVPKAGAAPIKAFAPDYSDTIVMGSLPGDPTTDPPLPKKLKLSIDDGIVVCEASIDKLSEK